MRPQLRSLQAQEEFANGLMSLGRALHNAVFLSVFVAPLTAFVGAILSGQSVFSVWHILGRWDWPTVGIFAGVYLIPIYVGYRAKNTALYAYDRLYRRTRFRRPREARTR